MAPITPRSVVARLKRSLPSCGSPGLDTWVPPLSHSSCPAHRTWTCVAVLAAPAALLVPAWPRSKTYKTGQAMIRRLGAWYGIECDSYHRSALPRSESLVGLTSSLVLWCALVDTIMMMTMNWWTWFGMGLDMVLGNEGTRGQGRFECELPFVFFWSVNSRKKNSNTNIPSIVWWICCISEMAHLGWIVTMSLIIPRIKFNLEFNIYI